MKKKVPTLPIMQLGNPILRTKASPVPLRTISTREFHDFLEAMYATMLAVPGVGLAAPQVGVPMRIAVIEVYASKLRPKIASFPRTNIINPRIVWRSEKKYEGWEGCLSIPSLRGLAVRHEAITVEFHDETGKKRRLKLRGFPAEVFQHEIDHLNGKVYLDRVRDRKSLMTFEEYEKQVLKT